MKTKGYLYFAILFFFSGTYLCAQQTPNYTQFVLNQYGLNPAVSGTNLGMEVIGGTRVQWLGFENAPLTTFVSVTFGWRKNFSFRGKHGFGFYAEDDRQGMLSSKGTYLSYAYHIKIFTGINIAAGISAGVRKIGINQILYDANDPAFNFAKSYLYMYPDVIPGLRIYTKKLFVDISARQLYKNSIEQGSLQIGSPAARLDPTLVFSVKRRFFIGNNTWQVIPAVNVQSTYKSIPFVQANCMVFYDRKIGVGMSVRSTAFASVMLQVKFFKNSIIGFAYDYTTSRMRAAATNSFEIMIGYTPALGGEDREFQKRSVANCPDFDF